MATLVAVCLVAVGALAAAAGGNAALVEHTFVVSQIRVKHLCKEMLTTVVNGQLPGPTLEVTEGDSVVVHVVNKSPHGVTIHWHGVKQRFNCWADGVGMITQCLIQPNTNFTYRFNVAGQEGTLWWHAHVACLRATIHGAIIIRPRLGVNSYPFPIPSKEIPIIIGEWWEKDLIQLDRELIYTLPPERNDDPRASTINGKLGDLYNCSGVVEDNYILNVEHGKTYLLRIVNAALFSEYYFKIAGHRFTVVAADANYVKPYTTDVISITPGETYDVLMVADASSAKYYMVVLAEQSPKPNPQVPLTISRGIVNYNSIEGNNISNIPLMPQMPDQHDSLQSFNFHGNLTSLPHPQQPLVLNSIDEYMFITLSHGSICKDGGSSCNRNTLGTGSTYESIRAATMNNFSFHLPTSTSLLDAHYHNNMRSITTLQELPDRPPRMYNFTDTTLISESKNAFSLGVTSRATLTRRFRYNTSVEIVFQSTALLQSESNPMHLHGHDFFVIAQGLGNYDAEKDVKMYNLVDPPLRNTVLVPAMGWAVIRFVTDNPGVWYLHCHYDFHVAMGMGAAFEVDNGPTLDKSLPPPPEDLPRCDMHTRRVAYQ